MACVEVDGIVKSFGATQVLKGMSLSIADGEFVSLVGPSGCGKSTLLRIIAGLERQDSGDIRIGGESVSGIRPADRNLAMVFQSYALYPHLSVAENIAVPLRMRRLNRWDRLPLVGRMLPGGRDRRRTIARDVLAAAETLDIGHLLDRKPGQLSGGQRQRVAVGRALVRQPVGFLLDEPLSNLDAKLRVHMRTEIAQLHRRLEATFVYVTHDQAEAMTMSDRIAVLMEGELLQVASPDTIYRTPADIRVAEFVGSPRINLLPAYIDTTRTLSWAGGALPLIASGTDATPGPATLGVRPEGFEMNDGSPSANDGEVLEGRLVHVENLGAEVFAHVGVEGVSAPVIARLPASARARMAMGRPVRLRMTLDTACLFGRDGKAITVRTAVRAMEAPARTMRVANV